LPLLVEVMAQHLRGTRFGIGADADGLLRQGAPGVPLTWMDAQVGEWVVTPRRGKAVEVQALWYNALAALAGWLDEERHPGAADLQQAAARARAAFAARFVPPTGWLFDVVDGEGGDDPALRPNQLLAVSLPHPILDGPRAAELLDAVAEHLVTPVGLRTLAPSERGYQPRYDGNLLARDAAYHQGTVWAWLVGPFADAWRRAGRDEAAVAAILDGQRAAFGQSCMGQLGEVFDAEPPHPARGCIAQAWSVGEVNRVIAGSDRT
jgi:predicted glycogen debranching enzyme